MPLAASFFLRIFIYGLVGFVNRGGEVAVLLVNDHHHDAFVGFEKSACDPNCPQPIEVGGGEPFHGFKLTSHEIELSPVTEEPGSPTFLRKEATDKIPISREKAALLDWIPSMASVLERSEEALIKEECLLPEPGSCASLLAARMQIQKGEFKTCRLVQHWNSGHVYSYEFKGYPLAPERREQALAEIVELAFTQHVIPAYVTLTLRSLGPQAAPQRINLNPYDCFADDKCLDVFVGNMPPPDCSDSHRVGNHFTLFYSLLEDGPEAKLRPYKNFSRRKEEHVVQPECEVQVFPRGFRCTENEKGMRDILSPESRSVCPMVVLDPPS